MPIRPNVRRRSVRLPYNSYNHTYVRLYKHRLIMKVVTDFLEYKSRSVVYLIYIIVIQIE